MTLVGRPGMPVVMNSPWHQPRRRGLEKDADQLLRLEQRARHGPVSPHGAVVAVVAAGVGHEDAKQRHPHAGSGAEIPDVERPEGTHVFGVTQTGRQPFPIVGGERH